MRPRLSYQADLVGQNPRPRVGRLVRATGSNCAPTTGMCHNLRHLAGRPYEEIVLAILGPVADGLRRKW